jgi:hypothetical protein
LKALLNRHLLSLVLAVVCLFGQATVIAGDPYQGYRFRPLTVPSEQRRQVVQEPAALPWRPSLGETRDKRRSETAKGSLSDGSAALGLPRGTYRPVERFTQVPAQVGSYQFRPISSTEGKRIDAQGRPQPQDRAAALHNPPQRYRFRGDPLPEKRNKPAPFNWKDPDQPAVSPRFRPDSRFRNSRALTK